MRLKRVDLLSLSLHDLELLTNRGTVKRASRELTEREVTFEIDETENLDVNCKWSDEQTCRFSGTGTVKDAVCTCSAVTICRHIIRSILAYQQQAQGATQSLDAPSTSEKVRQADTSGGEQDSNEDSPARGTEPGSSGSALSATDPTSLETTDTGGKREAQVASPISCQDTKPSGISDDVASAEHSILTEAGSGEHPPGSSEQRQSSLEQPLGSFDQTSGSPDESAEPRHAMQAAIGTYPWNPGTISDATLQLHFKKILLTKAKKLLNDGQIVEAVISGKPFVRFHTLSHTVRFLVPDDIRYAHCDCADNFPHCVHAPLAVLAFRQLKEGKKADLYETAAVAVPVPGDIFEDTEEALSKLIEEGIATENKLASAALKRAASRLSEGNQLWLSETMNDLLLELERYHEHDARFSSITVSELMGDLLARLDAIVADTNVLPRRFICGLSSDKASSVSSSRMIGLGCGARILRKSSELTAYFQDLSSGNLVSVRKEFITEDGEPKPFWKLASKPVLRNNTLHQLGSGQLLTKGGKLSPSRQYHHARATYTLNHQMYRWESLRAPLLVETFDELRAMIGIRPPRFLSPRHAGLSFYVCKVKEATNIEFNYVDQCIEADLVDEVGGTAHLLFPFYSVCADGAESLLQGLRSRPTQVRFVSGYVRGRGTALIIEPVGVVFEEGERRFMIQPWVDEATPTTTAVNEKESLPRASTDTRLEQLRPDPVYDYAERVMEELGNLVTAGLRRSNSDTASAWRRLKTEGTSIGSSLLVSPVAHISEQLEAKLSTASWDSKSTLRFIKILTVLCQVARHESTGVVSTLQ